MAVTNLSAPVSRMVQRQMDSGRYASEDEVLLAALQALEQEQTDDLAVREALATFDAGDPGVDLDTAISKVRAAVGDLRTP